MIDLYAIYLRKSRNDDKSESIEETLARHYGILMNLADRMGLKKHQLHIYKEVVSGESIDARPEMKKLLAKVTNRVYKGVLVVELERLARGDSIDQGVITQTFYYSETLVITPTKTFDFGNEYDNDGFEFGLFMSRQEYKTINRRFKKGKVAATMEGLYLGNIAPYGYKIKPLKKGNTLEKDDDEYKVLQIMVNKFDVNFGTGKVANYLNSLGIKPRKADRWTDAAVRGILKNYDTYLGNVIWYRRKVVKSIVDGKRTASRPINHEPIIAKGKHEPLITEEQANHIKYVLENSSCSKVPKNKEIKNPLSGIIYCADCGRAMMRRPYSNGRIETIICKTQGCHNVSSDLNIIEKRIIESLKVILKDYKVFVKDYEKDEVITNDNHQEMIDYCNNEIEKLNKQLIKICELLENETYTIELFNSRKKSIDTRINELQEKKASLIKENDLNKINKVTKAIPILENAIDLYWDASIEQKNLILKSIIDKCIYKKEKSGRWNKDAIDDFELNIFMKI